MEGTFSEIEIKNKLNQGQGLYQNGNHVQAKSILSEVIEMDPRNSDAYFLMANIFHSKGEIGKAIKAFNRVLQINPGHTDAAISLSVLYNDIGKYEEAKRIFDRANEKVKSNSAREGMVDPHINKKFAMKHLELAEMYVSYNRFDEALFEYNKTVSLNPEDLQVRVKIAKVYAKKGFVSKAFDELKKVKNEHPNFLPARLALGILYYGNGKIIEAESEWRKILAKDPKNSGAQMYLNLSKTATETQIQM